MLIPQFGQNIQVSSYLFAFINRTSRSLIFISFPALSQSLFDRQLFGRAPRRVIGLAADLLIRPDSDVVNLSFGEASDHLGYDAAFGHH